MKTTTLTAANGTVTVTVFRVGPHHYYADWSNETELEWLGGPKMASEFVARRKHQGWI